MTFTATYSPDDNKIRLYASSRLDAETYARVKAAGFKWAPKQDLFFAPMWTPDREDLAIELAGDIGDDDASLVDRAEQRAERFEGYRENRSRDAERARQAVESIAGNIPMGQPILVGHHSERHARRDAERIENGMRKAVKMWRTSQYWQYRAAGALRHAKYKELPTVRARRIKTIEADKRRAERARALADAGIKLWATLQRPYKDGRPCDDDLQQRRAVAIANTGRFYDMYGRLERGELTPRAAQLKALKACARSIYWSQRWIEHYSNRLTYERAMLDEQGGADLLKPKPKPTQLPLCNYRQDEGITIENQWNSGQMITYPLAEMTKAAYSALHSDYKGTRVVGRSHRIRTAMLRHSLVYVFLTDAKTHARPADVAPAPRAPRQVRPVAGVDEPRQAEPYEAMAASLAAGVSVVTAPQLFPTPEPLARQLAELAELRNGDRVLEPSAGTGRLIAACQADTDALRIVAVELSHGLADNLRKRFGDGEPVGIVQSDFLTVQVDPPPPGVSHEYGTFVLGLFDRIVMNPPFERGADIEHVRHALRFLKPGGRLVSVVAGGPRQREAFEDRPGCQWIDLPAGSFASEGTGVNVAIVVIDTDDPAIDAAGDEGTEHGAATHD